MTHSTAAARYAVRAPATGAQQRLWAVERTAGGAPLHNINMQWSTDDLLDPVVLGAAVADVMLRHETLRTQFGLADGGLEQRVLADPPEIDVPFVDLSDLPADAAVTAYHHERGRLATAPFDLAAAPLFRIAQIRLPAATESTPGDTGRTRDVLVAVMHHIVSDANSARTFAAELTTAVRARSSGGAPEWEPLAIQFADYAAWLDTQAGGPDTEADLAYWADTLDGVEDLDLTLGRERPEQPGHRGGVIDVALDEVLTARVGALATAERTTRFVVILAAFAAVLGRVFGSTDVTVGTTVSRRELPEVEPLIGMFVDRLLIRVPLTGDPSALEVIGTARDRMLDAHEHNHVGFDQIVQTVAPTRRFGVTPLAQVTINLQPRAGVAPHHVRDQFGNGTVRHDLGLDLVDYRDTIVGAVEFRHGVVDEAAADRVATLFLDTLQELTRDPERPIGALTAVSDPELTRLQDAQDGGPLAEELPPSWRDMVQEWVDRTPDAIAIDGPGGALTYRELADSADALGVELRRSGVVAGDPVLVALPRRVELPVALLGVHAAGAVIVTVDPAAPARRLAAVTEGTGATVALVASGLPPPLPPSVRMLPVRTASAGPGTPRSVPRPQEAAYVLFTSGSTGPPKGIVVEHRQLVSYLVGVVALTGAGPGHRHLMVQSPTFDSSWTTVGGSLATGGTLHLIGEHAARDPVELTGVLGAAPPFDFLKITPSHLTALLSGMDAELLRPRRAMVIGGEGARRAPIEALRRSGWRVFGHYGPTETTVGVLAFELRADSGGDLTTMPLGRPLPGVRVRVLDDALRPVPPGCRGGLYVGGDLVSRGYLGAPGQTAGAFRPDPFAPEPGSRMYDTGDIVRSLPDGMFEFCGRADRQVKIRGNRLELSSVEAVLADQPEVATAAVVVRDERLVGYVVATGAVDPAELIQSVATELPAFAVPAAVVDVEALPMTTAGKLDVAALPEPTVPEDEGQPVPPATPAQRSLAQLWSEVLGITEPDVTAGFFDLGGDSIRAIELASAARAAGVPLRVRDLFECLSIVAIATMLAERDGWIGAVPTAGGAQPGEAIVVEATDDAGSPTRLTITPADCADHNLPAHIDRIRLDGSQPPAARSGALIGPQHDLGEVADALVAASDAYGTDLTELVVAAVLSHLAARSAGVAAGILVADIAESGCAAQPALVRLDPVPADPAQLIRAARDAVRAKRRTAAFQPAAGDLAAPVLRVVALPTGVRLTAAEAPEAGMQIVVTPVQLAVAGADREAAAVLASDLRDRLAALVEHCTDIGSSYAAADFPDAGLDDAALARLLSRVQRTEEE